MLKERWIVTTEEVYQAIYRHHYDELVPYAVHTCNEGCQFHGAGRHSMTSWGFRGSNHAIIRCEEDNGVWTYYLLKTVEYPDA